jgi:hypothetical protein
MLCVYDHDHGYGCNFAARRRWRKTRVGWEGDEGIETDVRDFRKQI